jgi:mono/diheme cytochrome c family protein
MALALIGGTAPSLAGNGDAGGDISRGKYLFDAAGCAGCHTDKKNKGAALAGGRKLKTPFGVFYSPNITPDPDNGIGKWSDADFIRALRLGIAPDGRHYFPVFPYPSYTGITDADLIDLKAYFFTRPPAAVPNKSHDVDAPFGWRFLLPIWKALYFSPGPFRPEPGKSAEENRGRYLVRALGHCGECHTPRDGLGGPEAGMAFAGTDKAPGGGIVPNITPDKKTGIGRWSDADLEELFESGMLPDGDFVGSDMGEVVDQTTSRLSQSDVKALIAALRALRPVDNKVEPKKKKKQKPDW